MRTDRQTDTWTDRQTNSLITLHLKTALLWRRYVAENNKTYSGKGKGKGKGKVLPITGHEGPKRE
jgi:hypothetical protein